MSKKIAIIGCGWLGFPLAKELTTKEYQVFGTTTSEHKLSQIANSGIIPVRLTVGTDHLEVTDGAIWSSDIFIIAIPPKVATQGPDYHIGQLKRLLSNIPKGAYVIYVSSTSVYPSSEGLYDESFSLDAENTGNSTLYQAEQLIADRGGRTIVRPGGLLGEDRVAGRYFSGKTIGGAKQPVNYIHQADAVGLITKIVEQEVNGIYNLVAPQHPSRSEVYAANSKKLGFAMPTFKDDGLRRIIDGSLISDKLNYTYRYPDPRNFHT